MAPLESAFDARRQKVERRVGFLSRTLISSPTLRQILPARIRSESKDDFVCVGKDFIQLFEIDSDAHPTLIASKDDFDGEIVSANVIGYFDSYDVAFNGLQETQEQCSKSFDGPMGPQMLCFMLANADFLFFLTAAEDANAKILFRVSSIPMPRFTNQPRMLGNRIAADHRSRALAVATSEHSVFICYTNEAESLSTGLKWDYGYVPASTSRAFRVEGSILMMDFLYPPKHDPNRVILLVIIGHEKGIRPAWVEWSYSDRVKSAELKLCHKILPLSEPPNLLIPIKGGATFVLATRRGLSLHENLLTGSLRSTPIDIDREPTPPGHPPSSWKPFWSSWVRPRRGGDYQEEDYIYLASEDGHIYYLAIDQDLPAEGISVNYVGNLNCHAGLACAAFGVSNQGDVLMAQGESSEGCVWMSECRQAPTTDEEPDGGMHGFPVSIMPNWSESLDLVAKSVSRKRALPHSRNTLVTSSGRQPFGRLSELRMGFEARIAYRLDPEGDLFNNVSKTWVLPQQNGMSLFLLSSPSQTRVLSIPPVLDQDGFVEVQAPGLDTDHPTVDAAIIQDNYILQITESSLTVARDARQSLLSTKWPDGTKVVAAAIERTINCAVIALRMNGESQLGLMRVEDDDEKISFATIGQPAQISTEITSLAIRQVPRIQSSEKPYVTFVIAGTSTGALYIYRLSLQNGLEPYLQHDIPANPHSFDAFHACEDILILGDLSPPRSDVELIVLCGLRAGSVYAFELQISPDASIQIGTRRHFTLGLTSVKLIPGTNHMSVFAACDDGAFKIDWKGSGLDALKVADVYMTDSSNARRDFSQEAIDAFCVVPCAESSSLSNALLLISEGICFVTAISSRQGIVPRSIPVQGSPRLLIFSKRANYYVSVSTYGRMRSTTDRTVHDVVQFTSPEGNYTHNLDIGLKVYSITEWSFRRAPGAPSHVFVALGVGRIGFDASQDAEGASSTTGWIYLVRIKNAQDGTGLEVIRAKAFNAPVTSIATYGERGLVVCTWNSVRYLEYDPDRSRFDEVCNSFEMSSPGIHITTSPPYAHVTTQTDSTLTLRLCTSPANPNAKVLRIVTQDNGGARMGVGHTTIDFQHGDGRPSALNLTSTRTNEIIGLRIPDADTTAPMTGPNILFTADLPRSVMRITKAKVRPPWKSSKPNYVLEDEIMGIATDGTIYGFAILDEHITNRLKWVQRLCQRNPDICPFTYNHPSPRAEMNGGIELPVLLPPPGFASEDERVVGHRPEDMHVNADFLARLLDNGGKELLVGILDVEAKRADDAVSIWVRDNLEAQKAEVPALIAEVESVVDRWW